MLSRDRGREFAPAGDLLSFVSPNERRQSKGDSAERFAVELAARWRRCAQTATASQVAVAGLSRSKAAAGLREEPAL